MLIAHAIRRLFLTLILVTGSVLFAQDTYFEFNNSAGSSDYPLGSRLITNASYSNSSFSWSSIISDKSRAYLDVSHSQIFPFAEYSSSVGELGLQLRYLKIKDNQVFAGLFAYLNRYHTEYSYYNSTGIGMYLKWKHYFKATSVLTSGYDLDFKKFDEIAEASNTEHEFYSSYTHSFKTKTSFNFKAAMAIQDFWTQSTLLGMGRNISIVTVDEIPSNRLISSELRISQSLGPKLGLTLWLGTQSRLNNIGDSLSLQDGLENPFTDRFRWEGPSASLRLLFRVNAKNTIQINQSYIDKNYLGVPVYLFDFQTMNYVLENDALVAGGYDRADQRQSLQISWTQIWPLHFSDLVTEIELGINSGWTQNSSNDPLYDYESMNYSISINLNN